MGSKKYLPGLECLRAFSCVWLSLPICRAWQGLHVFPRLAGAACFPALGRGCMFSRAWQALHVIAHLAGVACFPALCTGCMNIQNWHRVPFSPKFATSSDYTVCSSSNRSDVNSLVKTTTTTTTRIKM